MTPQHPEVVLAVRRAVNLAEIKPILLAPEVYLKTIMAELEKLEYANRNVPPAIRK